MPNNQPTNSLPARRHTPPFEWDSYFYLPLQWLRNFKDAAHLDACLLLMYWVYDDDLEAVSVDRTAQPRLGRTASHRQRSRPIKPPPSGWPPKPTAL